MKRDKINYKITMKKKKEKEKRNRIKNKMR